MDDMLAGSDWWVPTLALAGGIALMQGAVMALRICKTVALSRSIEPLQAKPLDATARLLLVGDSTAVGTGASAAGASVAGLIAQRHPHVRIVNRACLGQNLPTSCANWSRRSGLI